MERFIFEELMFRNGHNEELVLHNERSKNRIRSKHEINGRLIFRNVRCQKQNSLKT